MPIAAVDKIPYVLQDILILKNIIGYVLQQKTKVTKFMLQ